MPSIRRFSRPSAVAMMMAASVAAIASSAARGAPDFEKPLAAIDVADYRGREWTLGDFTDAELIVLAFMGTECPLAKLYADRLVEMQKAYADRKVAFVAVMSNRQDSIAEVTAFARRHAIEFPVLKDAGNRLADELGAERTPEVFVFDAARRLRYHGRIDDQFGIGYVRDKAEQQELRSALDELLDGKPVTVATSTAVGCRIGRQKEVDAEADVTFHGRISGIFLQRCVSCHREGEIGPFALVDADEAAGWADMIAEVVRDGRMPPWHASPEHGTFSNDRSLTDEEKTAIFAWVDAGAPAGEQAEPLELPAKIEGWQLPREPDLVVNVSPEPFDVPAEGAVRYQYFVVDPKLEEDHWIEAAELLPGNRAVVHHILCFVRPKGERGNIQAARSFLVGYVPGTRVDIAPEGMAKRIPADSELVFQIHYTPIGTPQTDHSKLGIVFKDPAKVTHEIITTSAVQPALRIPPHEGNYQVSAMLPERLPDAQLLGMSPHMHLRGKAFRYELVRPDDSREILLDVPAYDFNWQTNYVLAEPLAIPSGSRIFCTAAFDNSEENLANPDPSQTVRWGDQTWDEMMIGYFHYAVPVGTPATLPDEQAGNGRPSRAAAALRIFTFLDGDGDGRVPVEDVPGRMRDMAKRLDTDGDGILTRDEVTRAAAE
jgi:peroxiredoxin/mono/diheme cytochrome c family protein